MIMIITYSIYLVVSILITIWVGRTLNKNGRLFLVKVFNDNEAIADSINHLLLVGFYLVNFGFISLALQYGDKPTNPVEVIEFLSTKIGLAIVVLGFMHFFNMRALMKYRDHKFFTDIGKLAGAV